MPQDRHGNEVARVTATGTGQCATGETDTKQRTVDPTGITQWTAGETEKICRRGARSAPEGSATEV